MMKTELHVPSDLRFLTNGTVKMVLLTGGNFGIGTSSPYAKLSVVGEVVALNQGWTSPALETTNFLFN